MHSPTPAPPGSRRRVLWVPNTGARQMSRQSISSACLRLALPKGRMEQAVLTLLGDAGIRIRPSARGYRPEVSLPDTEAKTLKPQNIVEMLSLGSRDLGFAGADWVAELEANVVELLDTGLDPVQVVAAAPEELLENGRLPTRPIVVASEYERLARRWIAARGLSAEFVRSYGATEVFPPEDADVIVDNTATGATLEANGLAVVDEVMRSSTRLYANPVALADPAPRRPTAPGPALLRLDSNEGVLPPQALLAQLAAADPELLRRYPEVSALEAALAARLDVPPERLIATAGADEAIDRACRAFLELGKSVLLPDPCFDMFDRCAALAGGALVRVPWRGGPFPLDGFLGRVDASTGLVVVVSPNNPTGAVATLAEVRRLAAAAPNALLVLDHVYVEYADEDLTPGVLDLPNVLALRTFSKAWGLAGCRVGYAVGSPYVIGVLRAAGGPYSVAAPSIALALAQLERGVEPLQAHVARIRVERDLLATRLAARGLAPQPSQANFVLVECGTRAST